nr:hypothetical protein [uncultured Lacibacter sp.]
MKQFAIFILLLISHFSCTNRSAECYKKNVNAWISEAPAALDEFFIVKEEILSNKKFLDSFSSKGGSVFITEIEYRYSGFIMPKLETWFKNGHGWLSFEKHDTVFSYKEWSNGLDDIYGTIQLGPIDTSKYRQFEDTLKLKDNWYAIVRKCCGCGS